MEVEDAEDDDPSTCEKRPSHPMCPPARPPPWVSVLDYSHCVVCDVVEVGVDEETAGTGFVEGFFVLLCRHCEGCCVVLGCK